MITEDQGINLSDFRNMDILRIEISQRILASQEDAAELIEEVRGQVYEAVEQIAARCFVKFPELAS